MKTIKLSALACAIFCLVSCSKESSSPNAVIGAQNEQMASLLKNGPAANGASVSVAPTMSVVFNPSPAMVNQPVTVTGQFSPASGETAPTCGKLQLQQETSPGTWQAVGAQVDVTATVNTASYTFTPTVTGEDVYTFRLHYIKGGCDGYSEAKSDAFKLDVINPCTFSITGASSVATPVQGTNEYLFTVTYTVNTCDKIFNKLKTQGGLTAHSTFVSAEGGLNWEPGTSTNTVIKWEELSSAPLSNATRTYVVKFTKAYSGTGPIEITGDWSVTATYNGVDVATASFPKITHNQ